MIAYTQYAGVDDLCIAVNPKHADFYEKVLLFEPRGGLRPYSKVNSAPALAKRLNMNTIEERARAVYDTGEFDANLYAFFFTRDREAQSDERSAPGKRPGERVIITPELLRYFFVEKTEVFKQTPLETLARIQACYPFYDFRRILGEVR